MGYVVNKKLILRLSLILFITALTIYAYLPALDNDFLYWDDQFYVTDNYDITHPTRESLKRITTKIVSLNYHPLTMLTLWFNAKISGVSSAKPFIITNVIIHILNVVLVFMLSFKTSNSKWLIATTTSLIFALHPMHVESVVWVSERKDLLYSFFFLTSILCYFKYCQSALVRWWMLGFGLFIFSSLSKATAVSLVPCLILIDFLSKRKFTYLRFYLDKIPFIVIALLVGSISMNVQAGGDFYGFLELGEISDAFNENVNTKSKVLNACYAHYYYLTHFIYPHGHSALHPYSMTGEFNLFLVLFCCLITASGFIWACIKRDRLSVFGIGFYCFTIFLLLQFIPVGSAIVSERYTYLAYIGLAFLIGATLQSISNRISNIIPIICLGIITLFCVRKTRLQVDTWQTHTTLFEQAVDQYPNDSFIRKALASGYWIEGQLDSALHHISYAIFELGLETSETLEIMANCYADKGNYEKANSLFNQAVTLDHNNISVKYHRGLNLLNLDPRKAIEDFNFCEQSQNAYIIPLLYGPRGRAYGLVGEYENALKDLNMAIELLPNNPNFYLDRAVTYDKIGKIEKAIYDYQQVLQKDPLNTYASERLAILNDIE